MTKRAVTYARVSSDDRSKGGLNLSGQLETCRAFALKKGYSIVAELAEDDRGVSGALLESPALSQALEMAAKREFDVLIVREIDRFARSLAKQMIVEQEFHRRGIELEFVLESYDNSPEGSFHKNIKAVIAEFERVKINERTRRGRLQKVKSGSVLVHGKPPYGYRLQERGGKSELIPYEPEARVVKMIFDWYVKGDDDHAPLSSRVGKS
jgi:site-specific DNA recombinase